jgi:hypothetical protein
MPAERMSPQMVIRHRVRDAAACCAIAVVLSYIASAVLNGLLDLLRD